MIRGYLGSLCIRRYLGGIVYYGEGKGRRQFGDQLRRSSIPRAKGRSKGKIY